MSVLITNAHYRNALAAIRSLGKRKIEIIAASDRQFAYSFLSKYCKHRRLYPTPGMNVTTFVNTLLKIVETRKTDFLFPVGVDTTIPVSYHKEKFSSFTQVPIADYDTILKAHDKSKTLRIAKDNGIPIPETHFPKSIEEVAEIGERLDYPAVIKRRKGSGVAKGIRIARSKADLLKKYQEIENLPSDSMIEEQRNPIIQEYVPGEIRDVCVLFNNGKPRAALTQRRIWTWPPRGGPGVINETIYDPQLRDTALRLLKKMGWHGLAQVEFKLDANGKPRLMEVNPKFWGTLELSIKAGIDFPYLLYEMTKNGDVDPIFTYKNNLTILWVFPYDMRYLRNAPNKLRNLRHFFKLFFSKNTVTDIAISDIKPEIMKFMKTIREQLF